MDFCEESFIQETKPSRVKRQHPSGDSVWSNKRK